MPVAQSRGHAGKALLVAGIGVVVALGLAFAVSVLANRGDVTINLGDDRYNAGQVESIADDIADHDGLPLLYQDLVGGEPGEGRVVHVPHGNHATGPAHPGHLPQRGDRVGQVLQQLVGVDDVERVVGERQATSVDG